MLQSEKSRTALVGGVLVAWASISLACSSSPELKDPTDGAAASADGSAPDPSVDGSSDAEDETSDARGRADAQPLCNPSESPVDALGVFVATDGTNAGDGSRAKPFASISAALTVAKSTRRTRVYVGPGSYDDTLRFVGFSDASAGVVVVGGWKIASTGNAWTRSCAASARDETVITSRDTIAVLADEARAGVGLQTLTIHGASGGSAPGKAGESVYGVVVRGESKVSLVDVLVSTGGAGKGGAVAEGGAPRNATCDGRADCDDGAPGASVAAAPAATTPGKFAPTGYVAGDGKPGNAGKPGHNGVKGGAGGASRCVKECESECHADSTCTSSYEPTPASLAGTCGCGGSAGEPGAGGRGGGAAVALYVAGAKAQVHVERSLLRAGPGGDGSQGSAGGKGGMGTEGKAGAEKTCSTGCSLKSGLGCTVALRPYFCEPGPMETIPGGKEGTKGGDGSKGGDGGGGSGGPSYGAVVAGGAMLDADPATSFKHARGGNGANGAVDGKTGERLDIP